MAEKHTISTLFFFLTRVRSQSCGKWPPPGFGITNLWNDTRTPCILCFSSPGDHAHRLRTKLRHHHLRHGDHPRDLRQLWSTGRDHVSFCKYLRYQLLSPVVLVDGAECVRRSHRVWRGSNRVILSRFPLHHYAQVPHRYLYVSVA